VFIQILKKEKIKMWVGVYVTVTAD
jgi:hypothetical protein